MLFNDIILVYSLPDSSMSTSKKKQNLNIGSLLGAKTPRKMESKESFEFMLNVVDVEGVQAVNDDVEFPGETSYLFLAVKNSTGGTTIYKILLPNPQEWKDHIQGAVSIIQESKQTFISFQQKQEGRRQRVQSISVRPELPSLKTETTTTTTISITPTNSATEPLTTNDSQNPNDTAERKNLDKTSNPSNETSSPGVEADRPNVESPVAIAVETVLVPKEESPDPSPSPLRSAATDNAEIMATPSGSSLSPDSPDARNSRARSRSQGSDGGRDRSSSPKPLPAPPPKRKTTREVNPIFTSSAQTQTETEIKTSSTSSSVAVAETPTENTNADGVVQLAPPSPQFEVSAPAEIPQQQNLRVSSPTTTKASTVLGLGGGSPKEETSSSKKNISLLPIRGPKSHRKSVSEDKDNEKTSELFSSFKNTFNLKSPKSGGGDQDDRQNSHRKNSESKSKK